MINTLYICEKPSQGRDIARILGCTQKGDGHMAHPDNGTIVTWGFGHLLETATPDQYCPDIKPWRMAILPIIPSHWRTVVKDSARKQFNVIKDLLKKTQAVVIATDADREGEVIAREILELCGFKGGLQRLWLSALDDASIQKALATIKDGSATENLYQAGLGRQRADWLIGMNMTMAASVLFGGDGGGALSVGRVQTPTLKLVVDRDQAIDNFKPHDYFELIMQFTPQEKPGFYAKWEAPEAIADAEGRVIDRNKIASFAAKVEGQPGTVERFEDTRKKQAAPVCLSLSQLQKLASGRWGMSAANTLEVAQSLYETHKATTYPRTDCGYLPESQHADVPAVLANLKGVYAPLSDLIQQCDPNLKSPAWNDKKITAHHGMIPTANAQVNVGAMNEAERNIYDLICRHYLAQFLGDYEYAQRSVTVLCQGEPFKAANNTPLKPGWKRALKNLVEKTEKEKNAVEDADLSAIPPLTEKEPLAATDQKILTKQTRPLSRFTEGTLIEAMKSISKYVEEARYKKTLKDTAGIGTEATRAAIIETLFKRQYLEKKAKQVIATEKGKRLIALLPPVVANPVLTAEMEETLDQVAAGTFKLEAFLSQQVELLRRMLNALKHEARDQPAAKAAAVSTVAHVCPLCQKSLSRRFSVKNKKYFWGCSGYPNCRHTAEDANGAPADKKDHKGSNEHKNPPGNRNNAMRQGFPVKTGAIAPPQKRQSPQRQPLIRQPLTRTTP
jgi:DNA topoisomerase-3